MSDTIQQANVISEAQVEKYLRDNPTFFEKYPNLVADIQLPHESGKAISLVERQVAVLRERNIEMRHRLNNLLDNARENDRLFDKTKRLTLALVESPDLNSLVNALYYSFEKDFEIHYTRLILFSGRSLPASKARTEDIYVARNHIGKRLKTSKAIAGGLDVKEIGFLFDDDAHNIGSGAIAILSHGNPLGVLAIGNQDPTYYHSSMGTLFLGYIAEVLNRVLPKHINTGA